MLTLCMCVCCSQSKPFFLPVDIQHTPCSFFIVLLIERHRSSLCVVTNLRHRYLLIAILHRNAVKGADNAMSCHRTLEMLLCVLYPVLRWHGIALSIIPFTALLRYFSVCVVVLWPQSFYLSRMRRISTDTGCVFWMSTGRNKTRLINMKNTEIWSDDGRSWINLLWRQTSHHDVNICWKFDGGY